MLARVKATNPAAFSGFDALAVVHTRRGSAILAVHFTRRRRDVPDRIPDIAKINLPRPAKPIAIGQQWRDNRPFLVRNIA